MNAPSSTSSRPLATRGGLIVPYITAWTGEVDVSRADLLLDMGGLRYRKEYEEDRDHLGGLWERWTGDYGDGEPQWQAVNPERQRTAMAAMRCQVCCGPASKTAKGWLFLATEARTAASLESEPYAQPPLCLGCAPIARRQCPKLRRSGVAFRAKKCPAWGMLGLSFVTRPRLAPRPTDKLAVAQQCHVRYGTKELRYVLGSQLLRELRRVAIVDLDAELAA